FAHWLLPEIVTFGRDGVYVRHRMGRFAKGFRGALRTRWFVPRDAIERIETRGSDVILHLVDDRAVRIPIDAGGSGDVRNVGGADAGAPQEMPAARRLVDAVAALGQKRATMGAAFARAGRTVAEWRCAMTDLFTEERN